MHSRWRSVENECGAEHLVRMSPRETGSPGSVHLVGAGPGDPGLLTVRGRELLAACDAVVYDALVNPLLLAGDAIPSGAERHFVGKRGGEASVSQRDITALLVRLAQRGLRVVRLKGGDPFVFGRGSEEAEALACAGVPFEIVPGITAGIAAPAYAGIPVTHRGLASSVTFVTGHEDPSKDDSDTPWDALAKTGGTLVLYMAVSRLEGIVQALLEGGRAPSTPAAMIEWGTHAAQRTITATLGTLPECARRHAVRAPCITVIGDVVSLRDRIRWFDIRPLFGRRVLVTRARAQASELSARLRALGAEIIEAPAIRIEPLDPVPVQRALRALGKYQWALFTSANAVELAGRELHALGLDARAFAGVKLAAVGPATADALRALGLLADVVPQRFVADAMVEALRERADVRDMRVLYLRAEGARDALADGLRALGARVDDVAVYRSVPDTDGERVTREALEQGVDLVTFTSASTVRNFVSAVGASSAARVRAVTIGPITSAAASALGINVAVEARAATLDALVDAALEALA